MTAETREGIIRTITEDGGGVVFDHSLYTPTELETGVVELAIYAGMLDGREDAEQHRDLWGSLVTAPDLDVDSELRTHLAGWHDDAVEFLNDSVCPPGFAWFHDGEAGVFGCFRIEEDDK